MDWQSLIVFVAIAVSAAYIGHRIWKTFVTRQASCCDKGCGTKNQIVTIDLTSPRSKKQ